MSKEFLEKLDRFEERTVVAYLPSLKKTIKIKPINLRQQKELITTIVGGVKGSLGFVRKLNDIIAENTGIDNLRVYDKVPISVALRKSALGNNFENDKGDIIDISKIETNIKDIEFPFENTEEVLDVDGITLKLSVPTLKGETAIVSKCEKDLSDDKTLEENVSLVYMFELLKYITSITIDEVTVEFKDIRISERIDILNKLPLSVYTGVSKFIEKINNYERDLLNVDNFEFEIDSTFFDTKA